VWMGALLSWETASFRNNVWIMGCTRLLNLSMYSFAVIRPWRITIGPTECHDTVAQTITEPPPCFVVGTRHPRLQASLGVLETYTLPDVGNCVKDDAFTVVWCPGFMVMTPSFTHLSITFNSRRFSNCSRTMDFGFVKLTSDSFCGNWVIKIQFCCPVTCAGVVLWFFAIILLNIQQSLSVNVDFHPLFLFADIVFPWFTYADITSETVALDTPNDMAIFVRFTSEKHTNDLSSFKIKQLSHFPIFSHRLSLTIIINALTRALECVNKQMNIQCCQHKFYSSIS
jgi:hypothetical protein